MNKVNNLTRGGVYTALTLLLVYISSVSPTSKFTLLTLASAIIPLAILTTNVKTAVLVYAASGLLCFVLGLRGAAIAYILFFGLYGLAKFYIERLRKTPIEILLKFLFFNTSFLLIYYFYELFFTNFISSGISIYLIVLVMQLAFVFYDYALTVLIEYINKKFV